MSRVSDRPPRPTIPFDSRKLALESKDAEEEEDPLADLTLADPGSPLHPHVVQSPRRAMAVGTTPPAPEENHVHVRSRTVTAHDPFTTSLLAEVARRAQTIETAPMTVEEAEALERDEDELTPTTSPGFTPR